MIRTLLLATMALWATQASAQPVSNQSILVSVHPMALLIQSAWPDLKVSALVQANQSPHDFTLKPSDMKLIRESEAVIWMGAEFEPYLAKAIKSQPQIDLSVIVSSKGHHAHGDHQAVHDPHLWLNPQGIPAILKRVQSQLNLHEPTKFLNEYAAWLERARNTLSPMHEKGFVSFHDAFHFWVDEFHLNQLAVVATNPEKPVGTRHVVEVRNILASGEASCLFVEPQFQARIVRKLHQGLDISVVKIDPMASNYAVKGQKFLAFYDELLGQFINCLN